MGGRLNQRFQRVFAQKRVDGQGVAQQIAVQADAVGQHAAPAQIGLGIGAGGAANIAAFGINDHQQPRGLGHRNTIGQGGNPRRATGLKKSRLKLHHRRLLLHRGNHFLTKTQQGAVHRGGAIVIRPQAGRHQGKVRINPNAQRAAGGGTIQQSVGKVQRGGGSGGDAAGGDNGGYSGHSG